MRPAIQLASEVGVVGVEALQSTSHPFYQSEEAREAYRQALALDYRIPGECKEKWLAQFQAGFFARGLWNVKSSVATVDFDTADKLLGTYLSVRGRSGSFEENLKNTPQLTDLQRASIADFHKASQGASDWNGFLAQLGTFKDRSWDQRSQTLRLALRGLNSQYASNQESAQVDANSEPAQLFAAFKHNLAIGYQKQSDWQGPPPMRSGTCRAHALAGARMADALGMGDSIVLSYSLVGKEGHATFAVMNPKTRQVEVYNWGVVTSIQGKQGSEALLQQMGDATLVYKMHRIKDGRTVAIEPSQMQQFLAEVSGFDPRNGGNPLTRGTGSLIAPSVEYGNEVYRHATRAFVGQDRNGATYFGASQSLRGEILSPVLPFKLGAAVFSQSRPEGAFGAASYSRDYVKNIDGLYAQIEQRLRAPGIEIPDTPLRVRIEAMATAFGTLLRPRDGRYEGVVSADGDLVTRAGVRLTQDEELRTRFAAAYYAGVSVFPFSGITNVAKDKGMGQPVLNDLIFSAEGRARLCSSGSLTDPGCAYLFAHATVLADYFGVRGEGQLGLAMGSVATALGVRGRINDDMPAYRDSSNREAFGTVRIRPVQKGRVTVDVGVQGSRSVEPAAAGGGQDTRLQGTVEIKTH